ncbi:hypothetical protein [Xylanimonas ulmi]|uniref:Copper(I)-binding protein n=1 Tax=Xylanimonas ulmi TaxID=228973 RepID=A0A4Q7M572_9MICO|nr:hypothetical protein [Xylanibacterium ulmi]RZS62107.1 hypothetical protein EV386_2426 [Xylanibacterium ulmi]
MFRTRITRLSVLAAAGALTLGACAPAMTAHEYAPSDGSRVTVTSELRGVNLLVVAAQEGGEGAVQGALVNHTDQAETFTLAVDGAAPVRVTVEAAQTVYLGTADGEQVTLDAVAKAPGSFLPATLEVGGQSQEFQLPVMDAAAPEYADVAPES